MIIWNHVITGVLSLFTILLWETQGRKHNFYRPTDLLIWSTDWMQYFYRQLSVFLTWLDFPGFGQSLFDITWHTLGLFFSFTVFFLAYSTARQASLSPRPSDTNGREKKEKEKKIKREKRELKIFKR